MPSDTIEPSLLDTGDIVLDREDPDPNCAVVVNTPPVPASEWHVDGRGKVAEDNPDYPATDPVVIVVYADHLEADYPYYTGSRSIPIGELNEQGVAHYAFPESRLDVVDERSPVTVDLEDIHPSPFHARTFDVDANREYIDEIQERGHPDPLPLVRPVDQGFELINGHKRTWAAGVAGLEEISVWVVHLDDEEAAQQWADKHLHDYSPEQAAEARSRLQETLGEDARLLTDGGLLDTGDRDD